MSNYDYQATLRSLYLKATGLYRGGNHDPSTYFDREDKTFLASIGAHFQEVYDFVEDAESDGEPTEGKLTDPQEITEAVLQRNELRDVVIHTVSVNWSSDLLRELADRTGGTYEEVR